MYRATFTSREPTIRNRRGWSRIDANRSRRERQLATVHFGHTVHDLRQIYRYAKTGVLLALCTELPSLQGNQRSETDGAGRESTRIGPDVNASWLLSISDTQCTIFAKSTGTLKQVFYSPYVPSYLHFKGTNDQKPTGLVANRRE